jgi:hypothetical protein
MKLEKLLAENILRFGAKNLDITAINQINRIVEQAAPGAIPKSIDELQDSEQVKAAPGYADVLGKLIQLANKGGKNNINSLKYWQGSITDNKNVKFTNNIINALPKVEAFLNSGAYPDGPSKTNAMRQLETSQLKTFAEKLKSLKQNNVYIDLKSTSLLTYTSDKYLAKLDKEKVANILNTAKLEISKILPKIDQQGRDGKDLISKSVVAQITDADKIALLAGAQEQLTAKKERGAINARGGSINIGRTGLNAVNAITIAPVDDIAGVVRQVAQEVAANPAPIIQAFIYPDIYKPNLEAQNFFGDNESQVTPEQKKKFADLLATAVNTFKSQGVTLTEIRYNAGSSTSQVWTRYIGQGKLAPKSSAANNKILATDRCKSIEAALSEAITNNPDTSKVKQVNLGSDIKDNQGPGYSQGQWKFVDGKIDPSQKAAYEETYGKHRFSFGAFTLVGTKTPPPDEPGEKVTYSGKGQWRISLQWNTMSIDPPKFPPAANVTTHPTNGSGIVCPKF